MSFGEFNQMMADRAARGPAEFVLPMIEEPETEAPEPECVHPFDADAIQWHAHRAPGRMIVTVDYVCPDCGVAVGRSKRNIKLKEVE